MPRNQVIVHGAANAHFIFIVVRVWWDIQNVLHISYQSSVSEQYFF